jgi:hypothetical protein
MQEGVRYPNGYQPYHIGNGLIAYFTKGASGLGAFSAPNDVMAVYVSDSTNKTPNGFSYDEIDKHRYYWSLPEEAYAKFLSK